MTASRSSVYLSGWEYNRLLQPDPTVPRNSALPGSILWTGSHQLWMFETIYCSKESFDNEVEATDRLGWVMGEILDDLSAGSIGAVKTIDWSTLPTEVSRQVKNAHSRALKLTKPDIIRNAIATGHAATLEFAKANVLEPILDHYGCFASGAPNSINTWIEDARLPRTDLTLHLQRLARPVLRGIDVCRPPGTSVPDASTAREKYVRDNIEEPMVRDLLAGDGRFAGPRGFEPYLRELEPFKDAYADTNAQLRHDWNGSKNDLYRLRDAARQYLWHDLHTYWLPLLASNAPSAGQDFEAWIRRALLLAPVAKYLTSRPTKIFIGTLGFAALKAALAAIHVPPAVADATGGGAVAWAAQTKIAQHPSRVANLAMFYQSTRTG